MYAGGMTYHVCWVKMFVDQCTHTWVYCGEPGMKSVKPVSREKLSRNFFTDRFFFIASTDKLVARTYIGDSQVYNIHRWFFSLWSDDDEKKSGPTRRGVIDFIPLSKLKFHRNTVFTLKAIFIVIMYRLGKKRT